MNESENKVFCTNCKHFSRMYEGAQCEYKYTTYVSNNEGEYTYSRIYTMEKPKYQHMCFKNFKINTKTVITPIEKKIVTLNNSEDNIEDCLLKNADNDCADYEMIPYIFSVPYPYFGLGLYPDQDPDVEIGDSLFIKVKNWIKELVVR